MNVEVIIVAYGSPELLESAIAGLEGCAPVTIVDNGRDDRAKEIADRYAASYLRPDRNLGFAGGVNTGLASLADDGADVLLLNPDALCAPRVVQTLAAAIVTPRTACVAPILIGQDGSPQRVSWPFPSPSGAWGIAMGLGRFVDQRDGFLIGAVLMLSRVALTEIGDFDESFFLYAEETDWQRRAADAGWSRTLIGDVRATHIGAATSGDPRIRQVRFAAGQEHYIAKWFGDRGARSYRLAVFVGAMLRVLPPRSPAARQSARTQAVLALRGARRVARDLPLSEST